MAVADFGVVVADVYAKMGGLDTGALSASSTPLSTTMIEEYIEEASAEFSGLLALAGITDVSSLDDDTTQQVAAAVTFYAAAEALAVCNKSSTEAYKTARARYEDLRRRYEQKPQRLRKRINRTKTNVSQSASKPSADFIGKLNYRY